MVFGSQGQEHKDRWSQYPYRKEKNICAMCGKKVPMRYSYWLDSYEKVHLCKECYTGKQNKKKESKMNKHDWLDKHIAKQREQREIIEKIIAPCTWEEICDVSERDELTR